MTLSRKALRRNHKLTPKVPVHQMITFLVRQDWFALPIQVAQKVVPLAAVRSSTGSQGQGLILVDQQRLPTIDLEQHIYRDLPLPSLISPTAPAGAAADGGLQGNAGPAPLATNVVAFPQPSEIPGDPRHVLIVRLPQMSESLGLVVSQTPLLQRVPETAFSPISATFLTLSQLRCVNAVISLAGQEAPIFLLDLTQVLPPLLPPSPVGA
jgi:chemotaxis signal transduction protein